MKLQIFGTGCPSCKKLHRVSERAARELDLDYELERVEEIEVILSAGVLRTPALGVDGELVVMGRVPPVEEVKELLARHAAGAAALARPAPQPLTAALR